MGLKFMTVTIASSGSTGNSSAEHLHLEVMPCVHTNKYSVLSNDANRNQRTPINPYNPMPPAPSENNGLAWNPVFFSRRQRVDPFNH